MFNGLFGRKKSKETVKDRLKLVLQYDRAKLSPGKMDELKAELVQVISKYFPADESGYDVNIDQQGDRMVLVANLPAQGSQEKRAQ